MKIKRNFLIVLLLIGFLISACGVIQPVDISSTEVSEIDEEEALPPSAEVEEEGEQGLTPDSPSETGLGTIITPQNAHALTQVDYLGKGNINAMAWSPSGSPIALGTTTGIYLIDLQTYEEMHFSKPNSGDIAFSMDGTLIASAEASRVILRDLATGSEHLVLEGHTDEVNHIAFSPIENLLATASQDETVKLWDLDSGEELKTLKGTGTFVYYVAFSPDGKTLISVAYDQQIILWDIESGNEIPVDSEISGSGLAVSTVGETIAVGGYDDPLRIVDFNGQVRLTLDEESKPIRDLAYSPDGKILASATIVRVEEHDDTTTLKLWDTTSGEILQTLDENSESYILLFSPDGSQIATASIDNVKLWNVETGQEIATLTDQPDVKGGYGTGGVQDFAWSPDGNTLALAKGGGIYLFNLQTGEEIQLTTYGGHPEHMISFSPDGDLLAVSIYKSGDSFRGIVDIFDAVSHELLFTLDDIEGSPSFSPFGIAFSPDGAMLATGMVHSWGAGLGGLKFWDVSSGALIDEFSHEDLATILSLSFDKDGSLLAGISEEGSVYIWDIATGQVVQDFQGTSGYGGAVSLSPDGSLLAVGGAASDGRTYGYEPAEFHLFDLSSGELKFDLVGHESLIRSLSFNGDGSLLASASWDNTVRLWDTRTGEQLTALDIPGATSVSFSSDGTLLATAGFWDVLRLWGTPETVASFPENLAGETNTIQPLVLGEDFRPGMWSQDGRYYYYTQQGPMDEPGLDQATNTLTFLDTHTGETCPSMVEIWTYSYNVWAEAKIPTGQDYYNRTFWMNDNRLLYLSLDGSLLAITPCNDSVEDWTDTLPESITAFHYGENHDRSQLLLKGETSAWLFTPLSGQSVKVAIPESYPDEETRFVWSPWEQKLVSSRVEKREGFFGIVVESIDPITGTADLIAEFPVVNEGGSWYHSVSPGLFWTAKNQLLLHYLDNQHEQEKLIDLIWQPVKVTDVFTDLFGIEAPSLDSGLSHFGEINTTGGENYYLSIGIGLSSDGQLHLYSAETGLVETYSFDPPKLLVFPNGDIAFAPTFGEEPMGKDPYQVIQIDTHRKPFNLEIRCQIPGHTPYSKVVTIPERDQLLIATDQGISLVDLESGETLRFWVLENQAEYVDFFLDPSPNNTSIIVYANQIDENEAWGSSHTRAIYLLELDD